MYVYTHTHNCVIYLKSTKILTMVNKLLLFSLVVWTVRENVRDWSVALVEAKEWSVCGVLIGACVT